MKRTINSTDMPLRALLADERASEMSLGAWRVRGVAVGVHSRGAVWLSRLVAAARVPLPK